MTTEKSAVIQAFISQFETELAALNQSAKAAHEAATHEESKSEDKHDTRATEASYLAQGQANRVAEVERIIVEFRSYLEQVARSMQAIQPGALVSLDCDGKKTDSFFAHTGGGSHVSVNGKTISIITPKSPLGEALDGLKAKDFAEVETKAGIKEYTVLSVI